jgi:Cd2+/Zn2+-exporting ATPase
LEALSRVGAFAFDKTGTLTEGSPVVTDVVDVCECGKCAQDCGLQHAAALELQSSHPLAQALLDEARSRGVDVPPAQNVTVLSGRGVQGEVAGSQVTIGSHAHFDIHVPHPDSVCDVAGELAAQAKSVILVEHDDEVCAVFGVADTPRASSREVVADLRDAGFHTVMLSGDDREVAHKIGRQIGLDEVKGGLLPEEKMDAIGELAREFGAVAMVGDGVNDAPALAQADVGIAMGGAGSDQAMETADVVLMGDDLHQLPFVARLSRRTKNTVAFNIGFSLVVKAAIFALAGAGLATLWMAVAADVGASLLVVLNGMRLRRVAG